MSESSRGRQPRPKREKYSSPDPEAQAGTHHRTGKKKEEKQQQQKQHQQTDKRKSERETE